MNGEDHWKRGFQIDSALRGIMEASPVGIAVFSHDCRILYVNPLAERLFGKRIAEAAGTRCGDFLGCARRHKDPQGCGYTGHCPVCPFYRAICSACTEEPGMEVQEGEAFLEREAGLSSLWLKFRVSSLLIGGRKVAVMAVDDITSRKRHEEQLRHALAELSVIHEHAPIVMLLVDRDRRVQKVNGFAARFADRKSEEMIGLRGGEALRCLHHLDDPHGCGFGPACTQCPVRQAVTDTFESGISQTDIEAWLPFPRGESSEERCLLISTAYLRIDDLERVLVCSQDITERKQSEKELAHSHDLMRYIIEHANSAVAVHDRKLRYIYVSQNYLEQYKVKEMDVIGKHHYDVFPDLPQKWRDVHQKALAGEVLRADRDPYPLEDGTVEWTRWECRPWYEGDGSIGGVVVYTEVITDQIQSEEALMKSEERYRSLFMNLPVGLYRTDEDRRIIDANPALAKILGFPDAESLLSLKASGFFVRPEEQDEQRRILKHEGVLRGFETELRRPDGTTIWVRDSARAIRQADGRTYFEGTLEDITEFKRAESEKAQLEVQYHQAQKVESIGRLAGGVAHDLNNLLSPILGYSEMLRDDLDLGDARRDSMDEIISAGLRARDLVRQLLAFSRKQILEFRPVNLNKVATGLEKLLQHTIREDIEMEFDLTPGLGVVLADIGQIEQVIMNLSVNAADAMPEGGKLTLETQKVYLDEEYANHHKSVKPGEYAMLAVSDSGVGMDEATREKIFDPFFSTKGESGTGLGLATVYGIVKQHGGNIWVYSELGKGSTFKVYLPVIETPEPEETSPVETIEDMKGSETILIVEDSDQVLRLAESVLKRNGYQILIAKDGAEALQAMASRDRPVNLLLTDVVLPGMNGRELYEKASEIFPSMKVLYMSGYTDNVIAHRGVLDEGVQFIQKPFTVNGLAAKVREVLDEKPQK